MIELPPPRASDAISADTSERRGAARHLSVFLLAKVSDDGREALGRIVNLSPSGARIDTGLPLAPGHAIEIEFRSDHRVEAVVQWADARAAGVRFAAPIEVAAILNPREKRLSRIKPRPPRYRCAAEAALTIDGAANACQACDVSLLGACLAGSIDGQPNEVVLVAISGLAPRSAKIAWKRGDQLGVRFERPLDFRDLDAWLLPEAGSPADD